MLGRRGRRSGSVIIAARGARRRVPPHCACRPAPGFGRVGAPSSSRRSSIHRAPRRSEKSKRCSGIAGHCFSSSMRRIVRFRRGFLLSAPCLTKQGGRAIRAMGRLHDTHLIRRKRHGLQERRPGRNVGHGQDVPAEVPVPAGVPRHRCGDPSRVDRPGSGGRGGPSERVYLGGLGHTRASPGVHGQARRASQFLHLRGRGRSLCQDQGRRQVRREPPLLLQGGDLARCRNSAAHRCESTRSLGRHRPEPQADSGNDDRRRRRLLRRGRVGPHFGPLPRRPRRSHVPGRRDLGTPVGRALLRTPVHGGQPHRWGDGGRDLRRRQGSLQHDRCRSGGHRRSAAQAAALAALLLDQPHRYRERDGVGRAGGDEFMERLVYRSQGRRLRR